MNKVNELVKRLHELLASGAFPPGARFPSEYELQERFTVSRFTANKAVALLAAEGLLERGVRGSGTYVKKLNQFPKGWIAVIEDFKHPYNMGMVAGAAQEAFAQGYMISTFCPETGGMSKLINQLNFSDCVGILGMLFQLDIFSSCFQKPVIHLDSVAEPQPGQICHYVMCDNYGAAMEMMDKILASDKKNVLVLGINNSLTRKQRLKGFLDCMTKHGIPDAKQRQFTIRRGALHEVRIALRKILQKFPDVDFIATDSDDIAFLIMQVWNVERPDWKKHTGLSGFGNVRGISNLHNLPTVDQHPWLIGSEAVKALLELVENGDNRESTPIQIEVPAEVINAEFI